MKSQASTTIGDGMAEVTAMCDPGDTVLSGSYSLSSPASAVNVTDLTLATNDRWTTTATRPSENEDVSIITFAQCFDNSP
jgi:hypothetical protein